MSQITLDHQIIQKTCNHCKRVFTGSHGSVYEDNEPIAIYLAAMHACDSSNLAHLVVAIRRGYKALAENTAVTLQVKSTDSEFQMVLTDASESPWQAETYLGKMLNRQQALSNPMIETFFHLADHIVMEIPEVNRYLLDETQ